MLQTIDAVPLADAGYGYDRFGLSRRALSIALNAAWPLYRYYFRVASSGIEHVPRTGPAILVANHSGMLPFDGMMLCTDVLARGRRVLRPVADHFIAALPFLGEAMQRIGAVGGTNGNVSVLLDAQELLLIFPEGVPGISKRFADRYRIAHWRPGHAELGLRHRVPIIPVAVVGAEEQFPIVFNNKRIGRWLGVPHLPIPLVPLPLPVKYRLYYGEPITFDPKADADDPAVVRAAASQTQAAVEALVARGLRERRGIFL